MNEIFFICREDVAMSSGVLPIPDLCTFSLNQALSSDFFADFQTNIATDLEDHCGMQTVFEISAQSAYLQVQNPLLYCPHNV